MLTGCWHGHVCWRQQLDKALLKRKNNNGTVKTVCFVPLRKKSLKILYCDFSAHFSLRRPHYCIWTLQEQASKIRQRSHLVPGHGARLRHSLGTDVNTPFFRVPTLEFGHGAGARLQAKVSTLYSGTKVGTGSLYAHNFCKFLAVHCFVLAAISLCFKVASDRAKWNNYVHSHISGTQSVNTTPFCASTQALVYDHQVWTAPKTAAHRAMGSTLVEAHTVTFPRFFFH